MPIINDIHSITVPALLANFSIHDYTEITALADDTVTINDVMVTIVAGSSIKVKINSIMGGANCLLLGELKDTPEYIEPTFSDVDATNYINAAGITATTEQNAVANLVTNLKYYNFWTKLQIVYPFLGGTATTNKWNLINPVDSDAAYRLTFNGGYTFSKTLGIIPNGTNTYAETYFAPYNNVTFNDVTIACSISQDTNQAYAGTRMDWGVYQGSGTYQGLGGIYGHEAAPDDKYFINYFFTQTSPTSYGRIGSGGSASGSSSVNTYVSGWKNSIVYNVYDASRLPNLGQFWYNVPTVVVQYTPANSIVLNAIKSRTGTVTPVVQMSTLPMNYWSIGRGLSVSEANIYQKIITAFNLKLNRPIA